MGVKPTYEELEQRINELEVEANHRKQAEEELRESEEKFKLLAEATIEGLAFHDKGLLLDANNKFVEMFGYDSLTEMLDMKISVTELASPKTREIVRKHAIEEYPEPYEAEGIRKDGSIFPVIIHGRQIPHMGKMVRIAAVRDITEQKKAEQEVRKSEEKYRTIFENIQDVYYESSLDGVIIEISPSIESISKYKRDELIGKSVYDLYTNPDERDELIKVVLAKGRVSDLEINLTDKDGFQNLCSFNTLLIVDEQRNPLKFVGSMRDITERKKAEEALQESKERLETLLHLMPVGIIIIDSETHEIVDANPKAIQMIGVPLEHFVGSQCHNFICPTEKGRCPITDLDQSVDSSERILLDANGGRVPIIKTVIPVELDDRKLLIECFIDITEQKKAEEEKAKLITELQTALAEIKTLRGILPLCSHCKKIRDDKGYWEKVDVYIYKYSEADISHSICPDCMKKHYPEEYEDMYPTEA
jgi:PAS domain S-box-containing protein